MFSTHNNWCFFEGLPNRWTCWLFLLLKCKFLTWDVKSEQIYFKTTDDWKRFHREIQIAVILNFATSSLLTISYSFIPPYFASNFSLQKVQITVHLPTKDYIVFGTQIDSEKMDQILIVLVVSCTVQALTIFLPRCSWGRFKVLKNSCLVASRSENLARIWRVFEKSIGF